MDFLDMLAQRNNEFAESGFSPELKMLPSMKNDHRRFASIRASIPSISSS